MSRFKVLKIVVAISGGGRSLKNLLQRQKDPDAHYQVVGVISSNVKAPGNELARAAGLPLFTADFSQGSAVATAKALSSWLHGLKPDFLVLAGFINKFPMLDHWLNKTLNIHPALLPKYGGKGMYGDRVHQAVAVSGDKVTGASVHFINEEYDKGPLLAQVEVAVAPGDDYHAIAARVFAAECDLYPRVLNGLALGELPLADGVYRYKFGEAREP